MRAQNILGFNTTVVNSALLGSFVQSKPVRIKTSVFLLKIKIHSITLYCFLGKWELVSTYVDVIFL